MMDIGVALRRFKGLVRWVARKYEVKGNYSLSSTDLEAEGLLLLVQCCRSFPEGQIHFARYFKRALYNRLQHLHSVRHRQKRRGVEVDLDLALQVVHSPEQSDLERMQAKAQTLFPLLSEQAQQFLKLLLEPNEEVIEYAWKDFCRKNKLHSQGLRAPGWKRFRIKFRHIRGVLGMTRPQMRTVVRELRHTTRQLKRRGFTK